MGTIQNKPLSGKFVKIITIKLEDARTS